MGITDKIQTKNNAVRAASLTCYANTVRADKIQTKNNAVRAASLTCYANTVRAASLTIHVSPVENYRKLLDSVHMPSSHDRSKNIVL